MRRSAILSFAVFASILIVLAPIGAADKTLAVYATNNSESDFETAKTAENVSIAGTGSSASVDFQSVDRATSPTSLGADDNTVLSADKAGIIISTSDEMSGVRARISADSAGLEKARLRDSNGNTIESVDVSGKSAGDWVRFNSDLRANTEYEIVAFNGSAGELGFDETPSFGYSGTYLDVTSSIRAGGKTTNRRYVWSAIEPVYDNPDTGTYLSANYSGERLEAAEVDLNLDDAEATVSAINATTGAELASDTFSTNGTHRIKWSPVDGEIYLNVTFRETGTDGIGELNSDAILFNDSDPTFDEPSANPDNVDLTQSDLTLEINVSDGTFATSNDEELTVEFFVDGESVGSDTVFSNGTASVTTQESDGGDHTWYAVATDKYGLSTTSSTQSFTVPSTITIYNESNVSEIIKPTTVTATFFEGNTVIQNQTTTGNVSLAGLPADRVYVLRLDADQYQKRTVILDGIYDQQAVYLLNENATSVDSRFTLTDKTGEFPKSSSFLQVQRPINTSSGTEYRTVAGGTFGPAGVTSTLETDQRYRLIVENDEGDTRVVGSYTPVTSEQVELVIGEIDYGLTEGETYSWGATFVNDSQGERIVFKYKDPDDETGDIRVVIHERGAPNNEILNDTFRGPYGELTVTEMLNSSQANKSWEVSFRATKNGSSESGQAVVGESVANVPLPLDPVHKFGLSVGALLIVAGLGANIDPGVGAVVTSLTAGLLVFLEWLPPEVGLPAVALALIVSAIWIVRFRGGP